MKVSFVIPSVDRRKELQDCISSIESAYGNAKNKDIEIEIIVVFNGECRKDLFLEIKYPDLAFLYYINERGLSIARNFGINKSKGEYIVLIDDDATIKEDFVQLLPDSITNKGHRVFCCRVLEPATNRPFCINDSRMTKVYLGRFGYQFFKGSSLVISKEVLKKAGLYDEDFGLGAKYQAAEESNLFFKIKMQNEKILYVPELVVFHPIPEWPLPAKVLNYSYGTGAMLTKCCVVDKAHLCVYIMIIFTMVSKNFIRVLQKIFLPKIVEEKDKKFQYYYYLTGIVRGIIDYIKFR